MFEQVLLSLEGNTLQSEIRTHLGFLQARTEEQTDDAAAHSWLTWASNRQHVKVVRTDVPCSILPDGVTAQLIDVKVFVKRGPDDEIFDNNKDIRDKVARGNCLLNIHNGPHAGLTCRIYALKKFTGGLGDDDDRETGDDSTWKRYFIKPLDTATQIVCTRKANGEAAHLSCLKYNGDFIMCGGSKNVHMIFRNRDDVLRYAGDRFERAREICITVIEALDEMKCEHRQRLFEFLSVTGFTGIFEILSPAHHHVEDLSHLCKPMLQFITWTSNELAPETNVQLAPLPPHVAIEIARCLGLEAIEYDIIAVADLNERMTKIRQGYGYEGEVLFFLDGHTHVIGLLKKKTIWYILCRAIREKARASVHLNHKSPQKFSISDSIRRLDNRLNEIQTWLGLDDDSVATWKTLGTQFLRWLIRWQDQGEINVRDITEKFPVTWKKFLDTSGLTDRVVSSCSEAAS